MNRAKKENILHIFLTLQNSLLENHFQKNKKEKVMYAQYSTENLYLVFGTFIVYICFGVAFKSKILILIKHQILYKKSITFKE